MTFQGALTSSHADQSARSNSSYVTYTHTRALVIMYYIMDIVKWIIYIYIYIYIIYIIYFQWRDVMQYEYMCESNVYDLYITLY